MRISSAGLGLIKRFEGFSAVPYVCPAGKLTIGYGHVVMPAELARLTFVEEEAAERLLLRDVAFAEQAVGRSIQHPLQQHEFDALVCFTFNVGAAALQRSSLRRVINRGELDAVPTQWLRWVWGGGRKLPGLQRRRMAELQLYQG